MEGAKQTDPLIQLRAQLARAEKVIEAARPFAGLAYVECEPLRKAFAKYDRPSVPLDGTNEAK